MMGLKDVRYIERRIAGKLIGDALKAGYAISVFDGEEIALGHAKSRLLIEGAMASTDEDYLSFFEASGKRAGWVRLIYGNGEDLISDYADNAAMNALIEGASKLAERLAH